MYNCEKCIHEELCDQPGRQLWGHLTKETDCSDFKDRQNYNVGSKWISVNDRLPEEDKDVLAFCYWHESWQVQVCHLSSNWNGQWHTSIAGQWVIVSHWQYLPKPPKGE